jgi:hypothetical protein
MPPNLWCDSPIDIAQRHSHYKQASQRIEQLERDLAEAREQISTLMHQQTIAMQELQEKWHDALRKLEKLQKERDILVRAFNSRGY